MQLESGNKVIIKIMIDTNIYDTLYANKREGQKFIELIESGCLKFYSTDIQKEELENMPGQDDKKAWSLKLHEKAENIAPLFAFGVVGAGWDTGGWATSAERKLYSKIRPESKKGHEDRNIAVIASTNVDVFVTDDRKVRNDIKSVLPKLKVLSGDALIALIARGC